MKDGYVHNMEVLDENESWELFLRKAICNSTNVKCPEELKNIGEEILKKCGGLPLAISVVGGLLATKTRSTSGWGEVLEEMRSGLDGAIDTISAILELSYRNLPTKLKACFLCLGLFKEDAIIKAKELVYIWVAQGLVPQEVLGNGKKMEDVARVYLNELISRNMVQVKKMEYDRVKSCHMHDLLHDLSIRKAKEEIDLEVVREKGNSHHQSLHKPRHRAIYFERSSFDAIYFTRSSFIHNTNRNQYLRSLFIHGGESRYIDGSPSSYWKSFELLRVLHFGNTELQYLPEAIGVLIGLKYLNIRYRTTNWGHQRIPRSWAKLKNLEVLDLRGCGSTIIDKVVVEMDSLRHLYSDGWISEVPLNFIRKLETLSLLRVNDGDAWQIEGMAGVSKLGIDMFVISNASALNRYLAALENLVCLTLLRGDVINMEGLGALHRITHLKLKHFPRMKRFPGDFPPSLSHLTLIQMSLSQDPMRVLERLPKLLHLKLRRAYQGKKMVVSRRGFPCLEVLSLDYMPGLRNLEIEEGAMPELNQFIIRNCPFLPIRNLPEHVKSAMTDAAH